MARLFEPMAMVEPRWILGKTGDQVISATTETKVTWEEEVHPSLGVTVSLANNRVTIITAGEYKINVAGWGNAANGNSNEIRLFKNGVFVEEIVTLTWASGSWTGGAVFYDNLVADDYIEIYSYCSVSTTLEYDALVDFRPAYVFSGERVGD